MIPAAVYVLCALTALSCALLLYRGYAKTGIGLLFWSALCFAGLSASNILLVIDLVVVPQHDFSLYRNFLTLSGLTALIYSLIWDS